MYFNEMFLNKLRRRQGSTIPKHSEGAISWYALPAVPSIRFLQSECTIVENIMKILSKTYWKI